MIAKASSSTPLSRRRFLRLISGVATAGTLSSLLAACGGGDTAATATSGTGSVPLPTPPAGGSTPVGGSSPAPVGAPSGALTVGAPQDRYRAEQNRGNIGMSVPNVNIFETLVTLTTDFQIAPLLAESWEFVEPNTWRFMLRKGVTFHDGSPFTAEAVKWTMARVAAIGGGVYGVDANSVKIVDDATVEITPAKPNRRLVLQMSAPNTGGIVAPNTDPVDTRIGTGPFKEVEYVKDGRYVVEAYAGYWGNKAKLARLTFRFMPDSTTRMLALKAGEVDVIYDVPREATQDITSDSKLKLARSTVGAYEALYFNIHGKQPYDLGQDPAIRQATALGIDAAAIINGVWQGNAELNKTMIPPGILGSAGQVIQGPAYDPAKAKQLLDGAGWAPGAGGVREKDGRQLKLTMIVGYPSAEIHKPMPELVQAQLKDVGIALDIVQTPDVASYNARLTSGEGDLWAEVGNQVDGDPCYLPGLLFYSPTPLSDPESAAYANAFAPGAQFDAFIDQCDRAASVEAVQQAAASAMKVLIDEQFVVVPLAGVYRLYGLAATVEGFEAHPTQFQQRWENVSVKG